MPQRQHVEASPYGELARCSGCRNCAKAACEPVDKDQRWQLKTEEGVAHVAVHNIELAEVHDATDVDAPWFVPQRQILLGTMTDCVEVVSIGMKTYRYTSRLHPSGRDA